MIALPLASTRTASTGTGVEAAGPTATIFPFRATNTPSSISGPAIGMICAPVKTRGALLRHRR